MCVEHCQILLCIDRQMEESVAVRAQRDSVLDRVRSALGKRMYMMHFKVLFSAREYEWPGLTAQFTDPSRLLQHPCLDRRVTLVNHLIAVHLPWLLIADRCRQHGSSTEIRNATVKFVWNGS